MYQTVGHDGISLYSQSMGLPLYRRSISGQAVIQDKDYSPTEGDEVEDLFSLLTEIKVFLVHPKYQKAHQKESIIYIDC